MTSLLPVIPVGDTLGKRHQHLNQLVNNTYNEGITLDKIRDLPEKSPLDHLFKIDLASKWKDIDYIMDNLKHEDMLYVNRALKSTWILDEEYSEIINPIYLDNVLYFEMTTTAVVKMKHWIEQNLKDTKRCKDFYQYYVKNNYDASMKFLWKCSKEFISSEVSKPEILERITPRYLKLLTETCPEVAKIFFDSLKNNEVVLKMYLDNEIKFYDITKYLLKTNGDIFLDINEKYFNVYRFTRFSPEATKLIMRRHKDRFDAKPELYSAWFLDIKTLAKCLTEDESKQLILKLARSEYLQNWFSYKNIEPLIKRLNTEQRTAFKKLIFVDKDFGDKIEKWPYAAPSAPEIKNNDNNIFKDTQHDPDEYECVEDMPRFKCGKRKVMKRSAKYACDIICTRKSSLDQLFDRYRFVSFEKTMHELQKQLNVETLQHRQNIMLVLLSKSGGRVESLEKLLNFLTNRHENEPENLRATVVRSLVRRCNAWRLPQNLWELILKFGRGLGLDGNKSTVTCKEGLHAVIIRSILLDQHIDTIVWKAFLEEFSTLKEYSLNLTEKDKISTKLPDLLICSAKREPIRAINLLEKAIDTYEAYNIRLKDSPTLIKTIAEIAQNNVDAKSLLIRLFKAHVARKELIKENFAIIQSNASYLNALKHDISLVSSGESFMTLINLNGLAHDGFIKALALYFNEDDGLAAKYLSLMKEYANTLEKTPKKRLARYVAILSGDKIVNIMQEFNDAPKKSASRRFAAALRANCHLARPLINLNVLDWKTIGVKAIANRVLKCSLKHTDLNIQVLLTWNQTQKLALILSMRDGKEISLRNVIAKIAEKKPQVMLKTVLKHLKTMKLEEGIWDIILPTITKLNAANKINIRLRKRLSKVDLVPELIKAEYCKTIYEVFRKVPSHEEVPIVCVIENILPKVGEEFIVHIIQNFLTEEFTCEKLSLKDYYYDIRVSLFFRIVAKYLLLCKSDSEIEKRWKNLGELFFNHLEQIWNVWEEKSDIMEYLEHFFLSLKYSKVFLDTQYICLPMFKLIVKRLQDILPLHQFYNKYIHLHLTMLYFKSVRQSIKNNPIIFEDLPKNLNQSAEIIGRIFGKLIAREIAELIAEYFESIMNIYKVELAKYFNTNFDYSVTRRILIVHAMKGILEHENKITHLLAEHLYEEEEGWLEDDKNDIFNTLKGSGSMEVRLFLGSYVYPW